MNTSTAPAETLNYPAATADQWRHAHAILRRELRVHGIDAATADDVCQGWTVAQLKTRHRRACPVSPVVAARWTVRRVRRQGLAGLLRTAGRGGRPSAGEAIPVYAPARQAGPAAVAAIVERVAGTYAGTEYSRRRRDSRAAVARESVTGGADDPADAARYASTATDYGSGYTPPAAGCPGLHTDTDPRPTWHRYQPQPLTGDALARYREALADHYASR